MNLFTAHKQWATRPEDERFPSLEAMDAACRAYAHQAKTAAVRVEDLHTQVLGDDVVLTGKTGQPAQLTTWAFGQLASKVGAPASYLQKLPPQLAAQNLNYGLERYADKTEKASLLLHANGSLLCRAVLSPAYTRIWNYEVTERLLEWQAYGWRPAVPDIRKSIGDFPALYASNHDMFAFIMNDSAIITDPLTKKPLKRGYIVGNSEVGGGSIWGMRFKYFEMCGNHIIWDASDVVELRARHVGNVRGRWDTWRYELTKYANESASNEEAKIASMQRLEIADSKEGVLDKLFSIRSLGLSRKTLEAGYDAVVRLEDGAPNTVWGMVQGLTRHSQTMPYADARTAIDKGAGKLLEMSF
jgi:hypothetical protein